MMRGEGGGIRRKVPMTISGFIFKKKVQKDVPLFHPFLAREKKKNTPKPVTTLYSQKLPSWLLIRCSLDDMHQPVLHPYILRGSLNFLISTMHCKEKVLQNYPFATCLLLLWESSSKKKSSHFMTLSILRGVSLLHPFFHHPLWQNLNMFQLRRERDIHLYLGKNSPAVPPAVEGGWDRNCHRTTTVWMMFL